MAGFFSESWCKVRRVLASLLVVLVGVVAVPFWGAPSAFALSCSAPYVFVNTMGCVNPLTGDLSGSQLVVDNPPAPKVPSSVLAAANGSGGTVDENVAGAAANAESSTLTLGSRAMGAVTVIGAAVTGYQIGQSLSGVFCSLGFSPSCGPGPGPTYTPNSDIVVLQDGWTSQSFTHAMTGGTVSVKVQWTGSPAAITYGMASPTVANLQAAGFTVYFTADAGAIAGGGSLTLFVNGECEAGSGAPYTPHGKADVGLGSVAFNASGHLAGTQYAVTLGSATSGDCTGAKSGLWNVALNQGSSYAAGDPLWYPVGATGRPAVVDPNPVRSLLTTVTCGIPAGGTATVTGSSVNFRENDASWPAYPQPACPAGDYVKETKVQEVSAGSATRTIFDLVVPTAVTSWETTYPQCTNGGCSLDLAKIAGTPVGDCFTGGDLCAGWFADPTKTSDYQCSYGLPGSRTNVALSECNVLAPTFDPAKVAQGQTYGDPSTGTTGDPVALPVTTGSSSCWPSGWSSVMNPSSWVLAPIKCALIWAFVPDTATIAQLKTTVGTAINDSAVHPWITAIGGLFSFTDNAGCLGPEVDFPVTDPPMVLHPFSACDEPMRTIAATSYAIVSVVAVVAGAWACLGAIEAGFGFRE